MKRITILCLTIFILTTCTQVTENPTTTNTNKKFGTITIERNNAVINRAIMIDEITKVRVTVTGNFNDITKEVFEVTEGSGDNITIENIPIGKNRVVSVEAMNASSMMNGVVVRKVLDIVAGNNSCQVNWDSTGLGNILYKLVKTHSYDVSTISSAHLTNLSNLTTGKHALLIDTTAIALDYKNASLKDKTEYYVVPSRATFTVNKLDFTTAKAQITDPASSIILDASINSGTTTTLNGVAPGDWQLLLYDNNNIVYRSEFKNFISDSPVDFGVISIKTANPVFSTETSFSGSMFVELTTTTNDAEIYYTLDGVTEPSKSSTKYTTPFSITETTTVKAKAFHSKFTESNVVTKTFTKNISDTIGQNHPTSGTFSEVSQITWGTASWDLGAHYDGSDVTFAVYSKNATKILLEIYETETSTIDTKKAFGFDARYDYWMTKGSDNIWRAKLKDVPENTYYAFRTWGPNWPYDAGWKRNNSSAGFISDVDDNGNRFNPNKVLFDPYARELSHDKEFPEMLAAGENGGIYGTGGSETSTPSTYSGTVSTKGLEVSKRIIDTGRWVPKGIVLKPITAVFSQPTFNEESSVIYEAHLRGITAHSSASNLQTILSGKSGFENVVNIPEAYRGTYKGAGYFAKYLKAIGVNTIELLPVHETENDLMPFDGSEPTLNGTKNYWGYMTYGFFAPDRHYAYDKSPGGPTKEFQEMVQTFNEEGIKVFLDVVYNHTGEGGNWGHKDITGFVSMGGFDAAEYYHLVPGGANKNLLVDGATGCGNQINYSRENNQKFVLDSLTYWIDNMGLSGFRFDLAAVLGRYPDDHAWNETTYWDSVKAFHSDHVLLTEIASLGNSKNVWMIAEAWDIWGYPVGMFPNGWGEWNGRYRDSIRKYMDNDAGGQQGITLNNAFHGDYDHFNDQGGPHKSINFLVAHDGFTLADLVSYNAKQNESLSWPFGPSDGGSDSNMSWDSSTGGTQTEKEALRRQRLRNFWTFQMFSRGTPMIVYGDELTRTQNGNNNPYNIDSIMTWNNYSMINTDSPQAVSTGYASAYHNNLGTDSKADDTNALFLFASQLMKLRRDTTELHATDYSETIGYEDVADTSGFAKRIWRGKYLICSNMYHESKPFYIPEAGDGFAWRRIIDTNNWAEAEHNNIWSSADGAWQFNYGMPAFQVPSRTMVVFEKVAINPDDGLLVHIKLPTGWAALTDLGIGRLKKPAGEWDGWYRAKSGELTQSNTYSTFLYSYGTDDYSFIIRFKEGEVTNEIFYSAPETFFYVDKSKKEMWIDMTTLTHVDTVESIKKFWTGSVSYTAP